MPAGHLPTLWLGMFWLELRGEQQFVAMVLLEG
jgi:hypothetical protein